MKRRTVSAERPRVVSSGDHSSGGYRETHAMRLRKAHSKSTLLPERTHESKQIRSGSNFGEYENIQVVLRRPVPEDDRSNTSSVIESAEAFLRDSTKKESLFARAEREVLISSLQNSPQRQSKPSEGEWVSTGKGWAADFGKPKVTVNAHLYSPSKQSPRNRTALDAAFDEQVQKLAERHEERSYARYEPSDAVEARVSVSHIVPSADPFHFHHHSGRQTDSKFSIQQELLSSRKVSTDYDLDSDSSDAAQKPSSLKEKFTPSDFMAESARSSASLMVPVVSDEGKANTKDEFKAGIRLWYYDSR
jgi:hypothetical protein